MKKLVLTGVLLLTVCITAPVAASSDRDGSWLIDGIRQYERTRDRVQNQSADELARTYMITGYIRGVLDVQAMLVLKADFYRPKDANGKLTDITKLSKAEVQKIHDTSTYFVPLSDTRYYVVQDMTFDQSVQIIKNYLEKHPERWNVYAFQLIEDALLESLAVTPAH
jgi:hypothetical protein